MARKKSIETNPLFGPLLRALRTRAVPPLSQQSTAEILEVSISQISRMENGFRPQPGYQDFYDRLGTLPGIQKEDLDALMQTVTLSKLQEQLPKQQANAPSLTLSNAQVLLIGDCRVTFALDVVAGKHEQADIDDIGEIVKRTLSLTLRNHFRSRIPR